MNDFTFKYSEWKINYYEEYVNNKFRYCKGQIRYNIKDSFYIVNKGKGNTNSFIEKGDYIKFFSKEDPFEFEFFHFEKENECNILKKRKDMEVKEFFEKFEELKTKIKDSEKMISELKNMTVFLIEYTFKNISIKQLNILMRKNFEKEQKEILDKLEKLKIPTLASYSSLFLGFNKNTERILNNIDSAKHNYCVNYQKKLEDQSNFI